MGWIFNGSLKMVFLNGRTQRQHRNHFEINCGNNNNVKGTIGNQKGILTIFDSVVAITTGVCAGGLMIDKKQVLDVFADLPLR